MMTKHSLPPGFEALGGIGNGMQKIVGQVKEQRRQFFRQCVADQTILNITVRDGDKKLYCVYLRHDDKSVTVTASKQVLDWLFRGGTFAVSGDHTADEMTFAFIDISEIKFG